jgi:hypothetical protein
MVGVKRRAQDAGLGRPHLRTQLPSPSGLLGRVDQTRQKAIRLNPAYSGLA